jgi:hypothetical protein
MRSSRGETGSSLMLSRFNERLGADHTQALVFVLPGVSSSAKGGSCCLSIADWHKKMCLVT